MDCPVIPMVIKFPTKYALDIALRDLKRRRLTPKDKVKNRDDEPVFTEQIIASTPNSKAAIH
jgi:hypothetical protein